MPPKATPPHGPSQDVVLPPQTTVHGPPRPSLPPKAMTRHTLTIDEGDRFITAVIETADDSPEEQEAAERQLESWLEQQRSLGRNGPTQRNAVATTLPRP